MAGGVVVLEQLGGVGGEAVRRYSLMRYVDVIGAGALRYNLGFRHTCGQTSRGEGFFVRGGEIYCCQAERHRALYYLRVTTCSPSLPPSSIPHL